MTETVGQALDVDALRRKYAEERARRIRADDLRNGFRGGHRLLSSHRFELIGRDGVTLTEHWTDGVRTFHGLCTTRFPNCCIESIAQAGLTVNFPYLLVRRTGHGP